MIIVIMIVVISLLITGMTIFGVKFKNEVSSNATEVSNNNANNNIDLPRTEANLKSSSSYNDEYASFNTKELQKIMDKLSFRKVGLYQKMEKVYLENTKKI